MLVRRIITGDWTFRSHFVHNDSACDFSVFQNQAWHQNLRFILLQLHIWNDPSMLICLRCCTLFCPKCLRCSANYCFVIWTCRKGMKIYQFWGKGQPKNESIGAQTTQDVAFHEIRFHLSNGLSFLFDIITTNVKSKLFPGVATRVQLLSRLLEFPDAWLEPVI